MPARRQCPQSTVVDRPNKFGTRLSAAEISIADTRSLGYPRLRRMAAGHSACGGNDQELPRSVLPMRGRPTSCIYCGRQWSEQVKKSEEHPLGEWMKREELKRKGKNYALENRVTRLAAEFDEKANEFVHVGPQTRVRNAPLLNLRTRDVCEDCNKGPLKDAQDAAKPIILQLDKSAETGIAVVLSRQHARELALWAEMAVVTYELTSGYDGVGNVNMGQQLRCGEPLPYAQVWLCRNRQDYEISIALAQLDVSATPDARPGPPDRRALLGSIVYHHFSLLTFISDSPEQAWPRLPLHQWTLLWPVLGLRQPEYPPLSTVSGTELTEIFTHPGRWIPPVRASGKSEAS